MPTGAYIQVVDAAVHLGDPDSNYERTRFLELAVSGGEGKFEKDLSGAKVTATVVAEGRGEKVLVFKLKRKKQYKKMQGHRQNYVQVRINDIFVNGKALKG